MRSTLILATSLLMLNYSPVMAVDLDKLPKLGDMANKPLLDNVNKSLADQQIKDGQFEFKTGKAEFAAGNAEANQKLSVARAKTVCAALKAKGMKLPCTATGVGSSKPLVSPEKTAAEKQRNRRVLVQLAR